ncbi:cell division protein FtsK [Lacticaseibacillus rhamnosus]|uniref:Cell division protein FtsK n=1 Tax=Lacticaseibacillus rhamnosus TaxID=47715 RepID=A0AAX0K2A4_LACRH|nr:cell division protein FtsK [Lacticaseibacillus rhamnosus]ONN75161.1 cell division protein FtsK [Lacticaseibacillus rhamnosus]
MDKQDVRGFLLQSLNMALDIDGETTYTNSFDVEVLESGFLFIPRVPCSYILGADLYQRIFAIANGILYPAYTVLKQAGAYFVKTKSNDIHTARAFFFPWLVGIPERLKIKNIDAFVRSLTGEELPLMQGMILDFDRITHVAIAGNSGAGKSYSLVYLLNILHGFAKLYIVDPKFDTPARWGRDHGINVIHPEDNRSQNDFVTQVNEMLSDVVKTIHKRQAVLQEAEETVFEPVAVVIDELLALSMSVTKSIKESFFNLLGQVALLGRSTKVHLVLVSQRFDANALPVAVREQANLFIQLGNINRKTTQFLFPDLESADGIVVPIGKGTGLVQVIDGVHPANIMPLLMPTYESR